MELGILFGSLFLLLLIGTPVAFALGIAAVAALAWLEIPLAVAFQRMAAGVSVFALMAIPFFIFAGELMNHSGIAERLVRFANALIGRVRGGLGLVNVFASMMFGAVSGSAVASASAMGSVMMPIMTEEGYDRDYAVDVTVSAATTGLLIPPSHNMIVYAIAAGGVPIGSLFLAGLLPGMLLGIGLMLVAYVLARSRGYPSGIFPGWMIVITTMLYALPGMVSAVIVVGGILSGVFTATESAAVAVVYTIIAATCVYRSLDLGAFLRASLSAAKTTAMVMLVIGTAAAFGWVLAVSEVPLHLSNAMMAVSDNPLVILLLINLMLLVLGTFMDMSPLIVITTPIFLPVAMGLGIDPVHFGVILILNLGAGLITPPVGSVLFVGSAVGDVPIEEVVRGLWPFYLVFLMVLGLVTYVPAFAMTLPNFWR